MSIINAPHRRAIHLTTLVPCPTLPNMVPTVIYDGSCLFCVQSAAVLRWLTAGRVATRPADQSIPLHGRLDRVLLLTDAGVYGGAEAIALALMECPWWRPIARWYDLPGVRRLIDRAYLAVSARRWCLGRVCRW